MLTTEQKKLKKAAIGGSEIAAVAGIDPYRTPLDVWLEKTGREEGFDGNEYTDLGHHFEQIVADWYAKRHGVEVVDLGVTIVHPDVPYFCCTPDRIVKPGDRNLQIKTVWSERQARLWGDSGTDEVPDKYILQVQWETMLLEACGYPTNKDSHLGAFICPLVGSDEGARRDYVIPVRDGLRKRLMEMAHEFWRHVEKDEPPPLIAGEDPLKLYREAKSEDLLCMEDEETVALVQAFLAAKAAKKAAEDEEARLKAQVQQLIGPASGVEGSWGRVTWKNNKSSAKFDVKQALKDGAIPQDVIERYTSIVPGPRVLRPKLIKGD